jgi:ribose transport system ATP-binding protein/rhamnose transport system ATP-binding protein
MSDPTSVAAGQTARERQPLLRASGISKRFGGIVALHEVELEVRRASVLALIGENGAGKSTLIKIISGAIRRNSGALEFDGEGIDFHSPHDATAAGVATVYQELSLFPEMTVAENLFMGDYPRRRGMITWPRVKRAAQALFDEVGVAVPVDRQVRQLPLAEQYLVEIVKALRQRPKLLILDEPTAALDAHDSEVIFRLVEGLQRNGTGLVFVSHRLDELFRICQHYVVLRDGRTVAQGEMDETNEDDLVAKMLSTKDEDADASASPEPATDGSGVFGRRRRRPVDAAKAPVIRATGLATAGVRNVSFEGRPGEVIGIAGLRGSGQTALCRALAGADRITSGSLEVEGRRFAPRSPYHAIKRGVGLLPIDRKSQGLFLNLSTAQNASMSRLVKRAPAVVRGRSFEGVARDYESKLDIRLPGGSVDTLVGQLSGGNQQKVVLARCLAAEPRVLVMDEPTRGVDVGAHRQIHDLIARLADEGLCVVMSSSVLSELLELCNSVLVLQRGEMVASLTGSEMTEHEVLRHASVSAERTPAEL